MTKHNTMRHYGLVNKPAVLLLLMLGLFYFAEAGIYSSRMFKTKEQNWIDISGTKSPQHHIFRRAVPVPVTDTKVSLTVSEFNLRNDTNHNQALIHWSGNNSNVIFILTRKKTGSSMTKITESTLWRSTDYGENYTKMSDSFPKQTVLRSFFISPSNKKKIIFVDAYNNSRRIWRSSDEGETYDHIVVPFSVEKLEFHPKNSSWLLGYDKMLGELHCSMDFGETWSKLGEEVSNDRYFWYSKEADTGEDAEKIVYFEYRYIFLTVINRIYKVKSCYIPNCVPTEFQAEIDALENIDEDSLVVQNSYIFVQKAGAANKLYISHNRGPFVKAQFPFYPGQAQSHFHIVSSDGECIVIGINHDNGYSHLFFSDREGKKFRQSLSNVRYFNKKTSNNRVFTLDIYEMQGLIGTYVANVHNLNGLNTTKITWDNGQSWSNITTNVVDENGVAQRCSGCSLNLHLSMDQTKSGYYMQSILAKQSYPGIILAHGTFGRSVEDNPNNVMLYVSKDNGRSWKIARRKRHFVVVSNHGAVIVAVKMIFLRPVDELFFSSDYGDNWSYHKFTDNPVNVDGILTQPGEESSHITLFGHKTYADSWRIFQINMASLYKRKCIHPDDFENTTLPSQISPDTCHLGVIQKIERRKPKSNCLISPTYSRLTTKTICDCSLKDYECDLGYKPTPTSQNLSCTRERTGAIDEIPGESDAGGISTSGCIDGHRNVSTGFRKIPGDICENEPSNVYWKMESCDKTTTLSPSTTTPLFLHVKTRNSTYVSKVGIPIVFTVDGHYEKQVTWTVRDIMNKREYALDSIPLIFKPNDPGPYEVSAVAKSPSIVSEPIVVKFWYPIKKVILYHPPVIQKSKRYNATALIETPLGLRGNPKLIGDVDFTWAVTTSGQMIDNVYNKNGKFQGKSPNSTSPLAINIHADTPVSSFTTSGKIQVREFLVTVVMEMHVTPILIHEDMTVDWVEEFRSETVNEIFIIPKFIDVTKGYDLVNEISLFVYVPPEESLKVFIYLAPMSSTHSRENLYQAALDVENAIAEKKLTILLANHRNATVKNMYVIDSDGARHDYQGQNSGNGAVIAVVVIIILILVILAVVLTRRFSRKIRFTNYLRFHNLRPGSSGNSTIVPNQDREQLVEGDFMDEELHTMEEIGNQDGNLRFQG